MKGRLVKHIDTETKAKPCASRQQDLGSGLSCARGGGGGGVEMSHQSYKFLNGAAEG